MKNVYISGLSLILVFATGAYGADKKPKIKAKTEVSAEQRTAMADFHQKMADCLRSDKPLADCHKMMKEDMPESCPMMDMDHGHGKHKMMMKSDD